MASFVTQAQVAHRSLLGPSRLSVDGVLGDPCATDRFSHNRRYLGRRSLARQREQARCTTDMVWAYPVDKENEMQRIGALSEMKWRVLLLVLQAGYTADAAIADHEIDASNFLCAASDGPESVRVEQVLTADQIDSSTVDVGALAVVVYEQGERHSISGTWTQLDTVRGYIKAVDPRRLIVGLEPDGWSKWIALDRIQTLSLIGAPFSGSADRDHTRTRTTKRVPPAQAEPEAARSDSLSEQMEAMVKRYYTKADNREALRIGKKVAAGVGGGLVGALTGGIIAVSSLGAPPEAEPGTDPSLSNSLRVLTTFIYGMWGGNIVGTAVGVSTVDPQDNFLITLAGSALVGAGVPYAIALTEWAESEGNENLLILSGLLGPIVGATIASERWSKPLSAKLHLNPEARRVSVGLVPDPKGGLSAVATMRF